MDKKFVMGIAAMAALTLVSCSSDDLDSFSDNSSKNEAISFDGYLGRSAVAVNGSRGGVETKETLKTKGFGVFSKYTGTATFPEFDNQKVTCPGTKWTYTPLKFWPTNGEINFYAYAPYKEKQKLKENATTFDFTVADNAAGQEDLLWANAKGQITAGLTNTKEKVKIHFYHALSRLGYSVKLSGDYSSSNVTFTLNKITLAGSADGTTKNAFYKTGTIDLAKATNVADLWDTSSSSTNDGKQNFPWVSSDKPVNNTGIENAKTDYLFVIPQDFSKDKTTENPNVDELYVIVKYTIDYGAGVKQENTVYKQIKRKFEQGKAYMLNLTIGLPIEFDVNVDVTGGVGVEDWGQDEEINIGSGSNDNLWDGIE